MIIVHDWYKKKETEGIMYVEAKELKRKGASYGTVTGKRKVVVKKNKQTVCTRLKFLGSKGL